MSEPTEHAQDAARSYTDPHADAQTSMRGTAGPEGTDPVDSMATETRDPADQDEADAPPGGDRPASESR